MKKFPVVAFSIMASLLVFSCGKDEVTPENEMPEEFSELTVEQNKEKLEANGIEMIHDLEDLKNSTVADASTNLVNLMEYIDNGNMRKSAGGRILTALQGIQDGKASVNDVFSSLRLKDPVPTGEPESFEAFFDMYAGNYSWVEASQEWNYTAGGSNVTLEFPAVEGGRSNDAVLSIRDYQGVNIANPMDDEYTGDLPTHLVIDMVVSGSKVMEYNFSASYNETGEPESLETSLSIMPFTFAVQLDNTTTEAGFAYSLKKESKILIALNVSAKGDFSTAQTQNADGGMESEVTLNEAAASIQLLNIKIAGNIDVKNLQDEMAGLTEEGDARVEKEVELLNKYYDLVVFYADSKTKIADTEFYTTTYTDYSYNYDTGQYEEVEALEIDMRLVFKDDTKADFETYFGSGFEDIIEEMNSFIEE
jgi:hypothetical protein